MSLQVVARNPVGTLQAGDERVDWPSHPEVRRGKPSSSGSVLTLTSLDIFEEARRRLALRDHHWD